MVVSKKEVHIIYGECSRHYPLPTTGVERGREGWDERGIDRGGDFVKVIDCPFIMSFDDNAFTNGSLHPFYLWQF